MVPAVVTFDLFSALIDSRKGGSAVFQALADERGWPVDGAAVYGRWDALNKEAQRQCADWVPFAELSRGALADAYRDLGIDGDPSSDTERVLGSVSQWPLWPDVAEGLPRISREYPVGILSNVDDNILWRTRAAAFVDAGRVFTSQRLGAYKPAPEIYHRAQQRLSPLIHVATSPRDVQGAAAAGLTFVHLQRDGHHLDPRGPLPRHQAADLDDVATRLREIAQG
ncbi:HAD family hydrolase [Allosalinactinospora lopnorensis]|uniref:HAD family hydrolase n=1 Tax=Allosalinactinospora lopnorensis TaxID=1352348 RepID=UPI000623C05F|nr:HAD family hydrolase [Allosalinactinospora lopnorensis]